MDWDLRKNGWEVGALLWILLHSNYVTLIWCYRILIYFHFVFLSALHVAFWALEGFELDDTKHDEQENK